MLTQTGDFALPTEDGSIWGW